MTFLKSNIRWQSQRQQSDLLFVLNLLCVWMLCVCTCYAMCSKPWVLDSTMLDTGTCAFFGVWQASTHRLLRTPLSQLAVKSRQCNTGSRATISSFPCILGIWTWVSCLHTLPVCVLWSQIKLLVLVGGYAFVKALNDVWCFITQVVPLYEGDLFRVNIFLCNSQDCKLCPPYLNRLFSTTI